VVAITQYPTLLGLSDNQLKQKDRLPFRGLAVTVFILF